MPRFSICLIILDIWQSFEYVSTIKYVRVMNMPRYSYNNFITIVTNIVSGSLSVRCVHTDAPRLTILSFFDTS